MMIAKFIFVVVTVVNVVFAVHPYFHKQFEAILIKDRCLKGCMDTVASHNEELSLLKNTHLKDYFNSHEEKCDIIQTGEKCVSDCKVDSNPFQLAVMKIHCANDTFEKIDQLGACFEENGSRIYDVCAASCGDYKETNDNVHQMTKNLANLNNQELTNQIVEKSNHACGIYKCMTRCNVDQTRQMCGPEQGVLLQNLIQDVLNAQRSDLERLNVVNVMKSSTPPQCDYMHSPDVIFSAVSTPDVSSSLDGGKQTEADMAKMVAEAQMAVFAKQIRVLEKQERILEKEDGKLNLEITLLQQKTTSDALDMAPRQIY